VCGFDQGQVSSGDRLMGAPSKFTALGEGIMCVLFLLFVMGLMAFGAYYEWKKFQFFTGIGQ
jgi:hypothetical protein